MIVIMKYVFGVLALMMIGVTSVAAYELKVTEITLPYEITDIESDSGTEHIYLGELSDYPIMYQITSDESFDLSARIRQRYNNSEEPVAFSLIVIRENERGGGVTEVARLRPGDDGWTTVKDSVLGMTFLESDILSRSVEPGTYRIEISTPENIGRYMLTFGEAENLPGYFEMLGNIRTTQKFFGYSIFRMLTSSYVYYTLGVIFLFFVIHRTWKYRKAITHVG